MGITDGPVHCRVLFNGTVACQPAVYENEDTWKSQKDRLDEMIQAYKERLEELKVG